MPRDDVVDTCALAVSLFVIKSSYSSHTSSISRAASASGITAVVPAKLIAPELLVVASESLRAEKARNCLKGRESAEESLESCRARRTSDWAPAPGDSETTFSGGPEPRATES